MQELNEAYHVLADSERRHLYDIKLNAYLFNKSQTQRAAYNFNFEKTAVPNQSYSFFSTPKVESFTEGDWRAEYYKFNLFVYHPMLNGCKDNITFWNLSNNPGVSMPINFNKELGQQLRKKLIPLIPLSSYWSCDDDVEITVKLPIDQNLLDAVLNSVFEIYNLPAQLIDFLLEKMSFSLNIDLTAG